MSTETKTLNRGQKVAAEIASAFRARVPLIWIVTREEARVEGYVAEAAASCKFITHSWDVAQGVLTLDGKKDKRFQSPDPGETLTTIRTQAEKNDADRGVWIMRDLPIWLDGPIGATNLRNLRNLVRWLPGSPVAQTIIILSPSAKVPDELTNHAKVIDWPLPDRAEIATILDGALEALPEKEGIRANALLPDHRDAAIDAAVGLSGEEAATCYASSLVATRKIDPALILKEKKSVIAREKVLEWFDPLPAGLDGVGGLDNLKNWLVKRKDAYSKKARDFGLPFPKGTFVFGVSGCGKSLTAKATATAWEVPLLKLDLNALKGKFVGESEGNLRKALRVIDAIGRCIVWIDEIEKAMQGATSGSSDGGVSADALGAILTWMEERKGGAFLIATANDPTALPPELTRKGRFDDSWFVDLPNEVERVEVLRATLRSYGRGKIEIDETAVGMMCEGFTGAEIAALVPDALYAAFADEAREITTDDLLTAAKNLVPLSKTSAEKVKALREWAAGRARAATAPMEQTAKKSVRRLEL